LAYCLGLSGILNNKYVGTVALVWDGVWFCEDTVKTEMTHS